MLSAVIDLGTNTFNLAIGEWRNSSLELVHSSKEGVAIGMGGLNNGLITNEAIFRALSCLKRFKKICENYGVVKIHAIGTSAIRDAKNKIEFCEEVKRETGIEIEVIDGIREAQLIYKGIASSHNFSRNSIIMDIGGGSTEFIHVQDGVPMKSLSFNIGVSRIFQKFQFSDPLSYEDIRSIEVFLSENCGSELGVIQAKVLVGASGSFETFYELVNSKKIPSGLNSHKIQIDLFKKELNNIILSTQEERDKNEFIIPIRKQMAPIAAVKTRWVIHMLGIEEIVISPASLKEGVFFELKEFG